MPPELDLFSTSRGSVTAPAGCGKTQLIAETLKVHLGAKPVLVLTHTNAGKSALEIRLANRAVPKQAYRIATIDSWAIRLISKFPMRSNHAPQATLLESPKHDYPAIRLAARNLLKQGDITDVLTASYSHLIVDEYQDCTIAQHNIVGWIAQVLPTYVLGDPLQAIFDFLEPTVDWMTNVRQNFPAVGQLTTPWRWQNCGATDLGMWLLECRGKLLAGRSIDLRTAPAKVQWIDLSADPEKAYQQQLGAARTRPSSSLETVLIIGDSVSPKSHRRIASVTPGGTTVEASDLKDLTAFGKTFKPSSENALQELIEFCGIHMTNLGGAELLRRVESLSRGTARNANRSPLENAALAFKSDPSMRGALVALKAFESAPDVRVYRPDSFYVCKAAMHAAASGGHSFYSSVVAARERNRHIARATGKRAIGSTLLLKGLEADIAVVLNPSEMNNRNLYVALTRGAKKLVVCSQGPILTPTA